MMDTRIIEIRDSGTTIICMASKFGALSSWEEWAVARSGYGSDMESRGWYVILWPMDGGSSLCTTDPFDWPASRGGRTMFEAHRWLRDTADWENIKSGSVVDVEFLLGETDEPKKSEINHLV